MGFDTIRLNASHEQNILDTTRLIFKNRNIPNSDHRSQIAKKRRCKRCHYSEHDIELMNQMNMEHQRYRSLNRYHSDSFTKPSHIKQPKIRDYYNHHEYRNTIEPSYENEVLNVNIGDLVNLTCKVNTKEIDWYFMDTNKTTTELSKGLQLYVSDRINKKLESQTFGLDEFMQEKSEIERQAKPLVKYKVTSDGLSMHTLTVYIESKRDEGSYQCIDSFSDSPLKKKITVHLSKYF
ncbi:hypothetical protein BpHYR1_009510 [Brachionus plicatilis]|uniref:Ig-like domain-containing protein n=1 Tax=Brachionus plicatilis TaxID=10195 RepID=A0A3M7STR9_BRAPC|nr:hypothetical protein BpHYR1_009510 [Brachionus plicatilis]